MGYVYNDAEMMLGTQLAYFDFKRGDKVGEVIDDYLSTYTRVENGTRVLKEQYVGNSSIEKQFEVAKNIESLGQNSAVSQNWKNWTIKDVCNDQNGTGYWGTLIDTGDGNAMIANRGSESYDLEQLFKDWIVADIGLLNHALTTQQARATIYMQELWEKYGDQYDSFSVTGHSLGGNLAEHMAITAPEGMKKKIDHVISMDGPGFSDEYIAFHRKEIEDTKDLMSHYQWSWVSSLLLPLPGVKDRVVNAHNEEGQEGLKGLLWKHDTHNVEYDDNGNCKDGDKDILMMTLGPASKYLECSIDLLFPLSKLYSYYGWGILIKECVKKSKELCEKIQDKLKNIHDKYIASQVVGDFEINIQGAMSCANDIENEIKRLSGISSEIGQIRKNIQFWGTSGAYYRSKILMINNSINGRIKDLKKLKENLDTAVQKYQAVDDRVANNFR